MKPQTKAAYELGYKVFPEQVLLALKELGFPRRRVMASFVKYHLETGFFNHAETYLKKENVFNLSREELYAIWGYTTRLFYKELNAFLRSEGLSRRTMPISHIIIAGLKKLPQHNGPAWREFQLTGIGLEGYLEVREKGKTVGCWQFTSCGSNNAAAKRGKTGRNVVEYYPKIASFDISAIADGVRYRAYAPLELLAFPPKRFYVDDLVFIKGENIHYISLTEIKLQ